MSSSNEHTKPSITVDIVILCWDGNELRLPLIRRGAPPFEGEWALPGGFLNMDEKLEQAARRELVEETGLHAGSLVQGPVFDGVDRDPRGRVLSVPYAALERHDGLVPRHGSDAADISLFSLNALPSLLAFDHQEVISAMCGVAAEHVSTGALGAHLLECECSVILGQLRAREA